VFAYGIDLYVATTDAAGRYRFDGIPAGEYDVTVRTFACLTDQIRHTTVSGTTRLDVGLPQRSDPFGYTCRDAQDTPFVPAGTVLPLRGDDVTATVTLPFSFRLYGQSYTQAHVSTNGMLSFTAPSTLHVDSRIPSSAAPNAAAYPFWDNLTTRLSSSIRTATLGTSPNRRFVIEWRSMAFSSYQFAGARVTFEVILRQDGQLQMLYQDIDPGDDDDARAEQAGFASLGIENQAGSTAFQYTFHQRILHTGQSILFRPPAG
jgi:hypothetical protein